MFLITHWTLSSSDVIFLDHSLTHTGHLDAFRHEGICQSYFTSCLIVLSVLLGSRLCFLRLFFGRKLCVRVDKEEGWNQVKWKAPTIHGTFHVPFQSPQLSNPARTFHHRLVLTVHLLRLRISQSWTAGLSVRVFIVSFNWLEKSVWDNRILPVCFLTKDAMWPQPQAFPAGGWTIPSNHETK